MLFGCLFCGHQLQLFGVNIIYVMDAPHGGISTGGMLKSKFTHWPAGARCKTCRPAVHLRCTQGRRVSERAREKLQSGRFFTQQPPICGGRVWGGKINALGVRCPRRFVCRRKNATRFHNALALYSLSPAAAAAAS